MKLKHGILITGLLLYLTACYGGITGEVVDAETGNPIEGAVVLVEWDITKGFGLSYTERYKVFETVTKENGRFTLQGVFNPFVNPPNLVIYKKRYVAWKENFIFPEYEERKDFQWKSGTVYRLERFKRGYLHNNHKSFITSGIGSLGTSSKLDQAYSWELHLARKERQLYGNKLKSLPPDWKSYDQHTIEELHKQIWKEVAQELYFSKEYPESKTPIMGYGKSTGANKEPVLQGN
jgi:hypothetical protein